SVNGRKITLISLCQSLKSLLGIRVAGLAEHAQASAALLAIAFLGAVGCVALADANAALATRAIQEHVRHGDRHLLRQPAALSIAAIGLEVPIDAIDAFDD